MEKVTWKFRVKAFGIAREILGAEQKIVESSGQTVAEFRNSLMEEYPQLAGLRSLLIAVNNSYAEESTRLQESDEIAIIPPVSGG